MLNDDNLQSEVAGRCPSGNKVRPVHPFNGLIINDDHCVIGGKFTGRESKPFKGDRTDKKLIKVQKVEISLMVNIFKRELHLR